MAYDYSALNGRIVAICKTQYNFAAAMNMSERSVSLKLNNHVGWKQNEIRRACEVLRIPEDEIGIYFFAREVQVV